MLKSNWKFFDLKRCTGGRGKGMKNFLLVRISKFQVLLVIGLLVWGDGVIFAAKKTSSLPPSKPAVPATKAPTPPPAAPKAPTPPPKTPPVQPKTSTPSVATPKVSPVPATGKPSDPKSTPPTVTKSDGDKKASIASKDVVKKTADTSKPADTKTDLKSSSKPSSATTTGTKPAADTKPADASAEPAKKSLWSKLKPGGDTTPAASAADPAAPPTEKKPSLFSKLSGAVNNAGGVGGIAAIAGGAANNPLLQMAAQKIGGDKATALLNKAGSAANIAGAAASGDVAGAIAGAGSLTGVLPSPVAPEPALEEPASDALPAAADQQVPVSADSTVVAGAQVAAPVAVPVPVQPVAAVHPGVLAQASSSPAPIVGSPTSDSEIISAFIQGLIEVLKTAEFNDSSLVIPFTASGMRCVVTVPLHPGLSNQDQPFNSVVATLDSASPDSVKASLMSLLNISPEEVFVIKVILMLNTGRKQLAADFDVHDFILVNLPMLLYRLEKTKDGLYAKSSHAAIESIRAAYRPILSLIQFPQDPWYERVMTDIPNGEATSFMKAISAIRWEAGHEDRTKMFTARLLPLLNKDRNPLEKAFFEYAILEQLQEYDGGFVKSDSADFIKRVIDSRLVLLEPMLRDAVMKMKEVGCDVAAIAKVEAFIEGIAGKPRVADNDADPLVHLTIPPIPVEGLGTGVDYFLKVIDPFMRLHIIHRQIHGDRGFTYFDFGYSSDQAKEALVALAIRSLRGMSAVALEEELTDIYFRSDHTVVDGLLGRLASTQGYKVSDIQGAVAKAKKAEKEVVEEEHDDSVMEPKNIA